MSADLLPASVESDIMCQNMMAGPTVIAGDPKRSDEVIFAGLGSPDGEDVQPIPQGLLATRAFRRAIRQGILKVVQGEDNPVIQEAMSRQSGAFQDRMKADELRARESIDKATESDMLVAVCIGPGTREGTLCGDQIPVRAKEKDARPPLCDRHQHLAEQCVRRGTQPWTLEG